MVESRVRYEDGTCRLTMAGNLLAATWFDAPNVEQMREFRRVSVAMKREHPQGTAMVNLIVDGTPRFHPGVRDEATQLMRENIHKLGSAHVVIVDGLRGSATRAFMTTVILVGRPRAPTKVFGRVDEAVAQLNSWLAPGAVRWSAPELRSFCEGAMVRPRQAAAAAR
jgi:hypothetical protein